MLMLLLLMMLMMMMILTPLQGLDTQQGHHGLWKRGHSGLKCFWQFLIYGGWKTILSYWEGYLFRGYVQLREGTSFIESLFGCFRK